MGKNILISAVADNFVPHLLNLLESMGDNIKDIDIGIIEFSVGEKMKAKNKGGTSYSAGNAGLSEGNKDKIRKLKPDCKFALSRWFIDIPEKNRDITAKIYSNKAFIPELFPNYDGYLYVDADICFFDGSVIDDWVTAGQAHGVCVYYQQRLLTNPHIRVKGKSLFCMNPEKAVRHRVIRKFRAFFGQKEALKYGEHPALNGGMVFIKGDHPLWRFWQKAMAGVNWKKVLNKHIVCDQTCLQYALFKNEVDFTLIGSCHHWYMLDDTKSAEFPMWCANRKCLVDYAYPHHPIKALHLGVEYQDTEFTLKTTDGKIMKTKLTRKELLKKQ